MRIAVTGANGHVGVNLCKALLEQGHEVRAFCHKNSNGIKNLDVKMIQGDLLDRTSLNLLLDKVEVVYHLAARISITGDPDGMVSRINAEGTRNILDCAMESGVKRFIHFSSIHAFQQQPHNQELDEKRPLVGTKGFAYDISKASGERSVYESVKKGLNAIILSPTAITGPSDPQPSLIGNAVIQIYNKRIPSLVPGGYNFVDVRDVVSGAIAAIDHGRTGEKYLLAGHYHTLKEFSSLIQLHSGRTTVKTVLPFWLARVGLPFIHLYSRITGNEPLYTSESLTIIGEGSTKISNTKAKNELGFNPRPFSDTMRDLLEWFRQNGFIK
ncbi:MAG: NAD-dependent epimerase/dehydratase family protein [bacterium]